MCASEKGKPVVRGVCKAYGPLDSWEIAGLPNSVVEPEDLPIEGRKGCSFALAVRVNFLISTDTTDRTIVIHVGLHCGGVRLAGQDCSPQSSIAC